MKSGLIAAVMATGLMMSGCMTLPYVDYMGMTRQQVFEQLQQQGEPTIGYQYVADGEFKNGTKKFASWNELEQDAMYAKMMQWRVNRRSRREKHFKEYLLTFRNGKVYAQQPEEWSVPPTPEHLEKVSMYSNGEGPVAEFTDEDDARIVELLAKANAGDAVAQWKLGMIYAYGRGALVDLAKAKTYFEQAAEKNQPDALFMLGSMYENGKGTEQNYERAAEYYGRAAALGLPAAQCNLAMLYWQGRGVKQDETVGLQMLRKAAENGDAVAQFDLGMMYWRGTGVKQDRAEARKYLKQAASQGHKVAIQALAELVKEEELDAKKQAAEPVPAAEKP